MNGWATRATAVLAVVMAIGLQGCGSVPAPELRFYRLDWPRPAGGELPRLGVLRVLDLRASAHLQGDALVLADGPVALHRSEGHRWAAPVERLVTEALIQGLGRSRMFAAVKDQGSAGGEDLLLDGRVLAFEPVRDDAGVRGRVALEVWIEQPGRAPLRREFQADVPCGDPTPAAAVTALSAALAAILDQLVGELRQCAPGAMIDAAPGR